ncbi:LysM domain-containing protein [Nakamurella panacisegetis]|uniref:LysM domain-containing protein n=1 Tax=Nakamurella panacisegetis TaxID=1090615 RepID=A0A1H0Q5Q0_9ACTN|nr:LysM peptidoglycan-binding domain-containing protein [Nakamurella panacisegetis]SDP12731.1 LysM domain-containing protein [Nakamurella panacisegetis]
MTNEGAAGPVADGTAGQNMTITTSMATAGPRDVRIPAGPAPRTAAGQRAVSRRRARTVGVRRPPSGLLPSSHRTSAVVTADRGDQVVEREFAMGRWARLTTTVSLAAAAVIVAVAMLSSAQAAAVVDVTVHPGDTLWSIAQQADPDADPSSVIDQIRRLNGLDGDVVAAGAVLKVPTAG